jgi:hypothetical protein
MGSLSVWCGAAITDIVARAVMDLEGTGRRSVLTRSLSYLLASACWLCASCDYSLRLEGSVRDRSGHPIVGAYAEMACPKFCLDGLSDAVGQLSWGWRGARTLAVR